MNYFVFAYILRILCIFDIYNIKNTKHIFGGGLQAHFVAGRTVGALPMARLAHHVYEARV